MVRGLVPSMSYMSDESIAILTSRSNIRAETFCHGDRVDPFMTDMSAVHSVE